MKTLARRLTLALAATLGLAVAGCGGGGFYDPIGGTLVVENHSAFEGIDTVEISQPFGPIEAYDLEIPPFGQDSIDLFPDVYDVELFWSDGSSDFFPGVAIFDGSVTILPGFN